VTAELKKQTGKAKGDEGHDHAVQNPAEKAINSIKGIYGSLDLSGGFNFAINLDIKTEEEAVEMAKSLTGLLFIGKQTLAGQAQKDPKQATLLEVVNNTTVNSTANSLSIVIDLNQQLTDQILDMVKEAVRK
jgi:hypothetical protein